MIGSCGLAISEDGQWFSGGPTWRPLSTGSMTYGMAEEFREVVVAYLAAGRAV